MNASQRLQRPLLVLALALVVLGAGCGDDGAKAPAAPAAPGPTASREAPPLSVTDLVELKQLGFTDDQIRAEVSKSSSRPQLAAEDLERLRQAGFSEAAIAALKGAAPAVLDLDGIVDLAAAGVTVEEILERIEASGQTRELTAAGALDLRRRQVPAAVIFALKGRPLGVEDLKRLAPTGLPPAAWSKLIALVGVATVQLAPAEALELVRAGVPRDIVAEMRATEAPAARPATPPAAEPAAEPGPPAAPPAAPTAGTASSWKGLSVATPPHAPGVYRHAGRRFVMRFPESWRVLRALDDGEVSYFFTPEAGQTNPHACRVVVQVQQYPTPEASTMRGKDPSSILEHMLPAFKQWEPQLEPEGDVTAARLGRLEAAKVRFSGGLRLTPGDFTIEVLIAADGQQTYLVVTQAPRTEYGGWTATFRKILAESTFGRPAATRRAESLEARHIVRKYKASTVSITALTEGRGGTGTGWIVSKDGYLLTNHHVIWNAQAKRPHTEFWVEWDDSLKRKKQPAKLLGYKYKMSVYQLQHGTDIALMKIAPGDYQPWPLTPMSAVEAGDRVVTLGFPSRGMLSGISITVTTGVVTRFNRGPRGSVETIFTDAAITHGSSGGPCVSLVTGGVIGLNTFGQSVNIEERARKLNDLLNYFGVVPVDACLEEFPLVTELGLSYEGAELDFLDSFALARQYAQMGSHDAAERLAARAVALKPREADAHWLLATCKYERAWSSVREEGVAAFKQQLPAIVKAFQYALDLDPKHRSSLTMLAQLHLDLDKAAEAVPYADRAIEADPENWEGHFLRGRCALALKKYADAVRYATKTKELSGKTFVHPYVLAGAAHYANGLLEAGKAEYDEAARLDPADLQARLGVAEYADLKKQTDDAVAEYRRILGDFPDNPVVHLRIGNSFYQAKRFPDAVASLSTAFNQYRKLGETPPEELFWVLGDALRQEKKMDMAAHVYATALSYHGRSETADRLHVQLANLHLDAKRQGLASAHVRAAHALTRDEALKREAAKVRLSPLSLEEIKTMMGLEYPLGVAYPLIVSSPLGFAVQTEQDVRTLQQQHRLPPAIIHAILKSQEQHGGAQQGPGGRPQQPAGRTDAGLVGLWVTRGTTQDGRVYALAVRFAANGQYATETYIDNRLVESEKGVYQANRTHITSKSTAGEVETYAYRLSGDTLALQLPSGQEFVLQRRREQR